MKKVYLLFSFTYIKLIRLKRILVTIDGSTQSMKAADWAISMAQKYDSELVALHVLYSNKGFAFYTETATGLVTPSSINDLKEEAKEEAEKWFDEIRKKCADTSLQVKTEAIIAPISIVEAIISYSENEDIDLIVMGSRGRSSFKKLILGSSASGIMTYAHCPVMIVK